MSYIVPMEKPKYCNRCPFGMGNYSYPLGENSTSQIDGQQNGARTYGYVCNIEFNENNRYTKILRAKIESNIPRPEWCGLEEVQGE